MDKIAKLLHTLAPKGKERVAELLRRIRIGDLGGLDVKKLVDRKNLYRVRKGDFRVIFEQENSKIYVKDVSRRSEHIYGDI